LTLLRYFSKTKRPTKTEALYSEVGPADPKSSARRGRSTSRKLSTRTKSRYRTPCESSTKREGSRQSHQAKSKSTTASSSDSPSSDDEHDRKTTAVTRPKHILKPPKFDGTTSFQKFWAQLFRNCVRHNRWDRSTKLVYLRNLLDKDVAKVLWDYGKEVTESLSGLTKILKMRFGGKTFSDKHRIEIRN